MLGRNGPGRGTARAAPGRRDASQLVGGECRPWRPRAAAGAWWLDALGWRRGVGVGVGPAGEGVVDGGPPVPGVPPGRGGRGPGVCTDRWGMTRFILPGDPLGAGCYASGGEPIWVGGGVVCVPRGTSPCSPWYGVGRGGAVPPGVAEGEVPAVGQVPQAWGPVYIPFPSGFTQAVHLSTVYEASSGAFTSLERTASGLLGPARVRQLSGSVGFSPVFERMRVEILGAGGEEIAVIPHKSGGGPGADGALGSGPLALQPVDVDIFVPSDRWGVRLLNFLSGAPPWVTLGGVNLNVVYEVLR